MGGKTKTSWKKGCPSPNPSGRPPKEKALTDILRSTGEKCLQDIDGQTKPASEIVARLIWQAVTCAKIQFPGDSKPVEIPIKEWQSIFQWLYERIDGPPPKPVELSGPGGGSIPLALSRYADTVMDLSEDEFIGVVTTTLDDFQEGGDSEAEAEEP